MTSEDSIDWTQLAALRQRFIQNEGPGPDYWQNEETLRLYDRFFAERIGWKWDAVLRELKLRDWWPQSKILLDWGCGTGIATRKILQFWPELPIERVLLFDRSSQATSFASNRLRESFPDARFEIECLHSVPDPVGPRPDSAYTLILSHVLNEAAQETQSEILKLGAAAQSLLWVEAGTRTVSRQLVGFRERWLEDLNPVAPCPHAAGCGLLDSKNEAHWCHSFARSPSRSAHVLRMGRIQQSSQHRPAQPPLLFPCHAEVRRE
jgi:ribosomal protein RSM22 (predicted rRNA methylase)